MDSPDIDLSEWVALKNDIFVANHDNEKIEFICGWNDDENKIAIIFHEGSRKASDHHRRNKATLISVSELYNMNQQLCLINPSINRHYPTFSQPNNLFVSNLFSGHIKIREDNLKMIEHYLYEVVRTFGKKLALSLIFDDDSVNDYEENMNELRIRTLETTISKNFAELEEILNLRKRAETLLELKSLYALEDEIASKISVSLSELYNFQLQPFNELRELSHNKLTAAKRRLEDEIGPNIKKAIQLELHEWTEQFFIASEAIQQLYQEYYRKTLSLVEGQRDRIRKDQSNFGKAAFCLHALPRLERLEIEVCQEKIKLLNSIKAMDENNRDKLKQQFTFINVDSNVPKELFRIENEVYEAQKRVLDSQLEVLDSEERLYKTQLAILNREISDDLELGVFYEAAETVEDMDEIELVTPEKDPKIVTLKKKLNKIYRTRAVIRNRKKKLESDSNKKKEMKSTMYENEMKATVIKRPEKKINTKELPIDKLKEERKKTIQRLRAFKKKSELSSKLDRNTKNENGAITETKRISEPINDDEGGKHISNASCSSNTSMDKLHHTSVSSVHSPPPPPPLPAMNKIPVPPPLPSVNNIPIPPPLPSMNNIPIPPPPPPPLNNIVPIPPPLPSLNKNTSISPSLLSNNSNKSVPSANITSDSIFSAKKALKKPISTEKKVSLTPQPFNVDEIIAMKQRLKKPSLTHVSAKALPEANDFMAMLKSTMDQIRTHTEVSDQESLDGSEFE